jgi:hypothetical protein
MVEREKLIHRFLDGDLKVTEEQAFQQRVIHDPEGKRVLQRAMELRDQLKSLPCHAASSGLTERIMCALPATSDRRPFSYFLLRPVAVPSWMLLTLLLGLGAVLVLHFRDPTAITNPPAKQPPVAHQFQYMMKPTGSHCPPPATIMVRFQLKAPQAKQVFLAGDFNGWSVTTTPLAEMDGSGVWSVTVPLAPGRYQYKFLVDGRRWVIEPDAPAYHSDGFGGRNSVLIL